MRGFATALRSALVFPGLVTRRRLHMRRTHEGATVRMLDEPRYLVFRETVLDVEPEVGGAVLLVGFHLRRLGRAPLLHWLFQRVCIMTTPFWAGVPGFHAKLWLVDPKTFDYGGIYEWRSAEDADRYVARLAPLLRRLSTPGSVWHVTEAPRTLTGYLDSMGRSTLPMPRPASDDAVHGRVAAGSR